MTDQSHGGDHDERADGPTVTLRERLTADEARLLAQQGVTAAKVGDAVPAETLAHLAGVPTLRRIDLSGRPDLVDDHLAFLEHLPLVTAVSLAGCRSIGDHGVTYLRAHEALEEIDLGGTQAGDVAVGILLNKPALRHIVFGTGLTDAGVARLRECPALAGGGPARAMLGFGSATALTDRALASMADLAGVVELDLSFWHYGSRHYTARGVAHLRRMASLESLNFDGALTTDAVLREIAGIPRLRVLRCQDMVAGDEGVAALAGCASLEEIWGRRCFFITDRGFGELRRLPRLRKLAVGGPRVGNTAMASLADAPALTELWPFLFGDEAFAFVARMPQLDTLINMYNRDTTDAATRHLDGHLRLVRYEAYGTQITDESLKLLGGVRTLESLEFENCSGITDAGLRALAGLPRLRRLAVRSCPRVAGDWRPGVRPDVEMSSGPGDPGEIEGYRFETLLEYPDLPVSEANTAPRAEGGGPALLSPAVCFNCRAERGDEGLRVSRAPRPGARHAGLLTREAFAIPLRIDMVVEPAGELRLSFGRGDLVFDEGDPIQLRARDPRTGRYEEIVLIKAVDPRGPARISWEIGPHDCRVVVNGEPRHRWHGDFEGLRSRVGIGPRRSSLTVRDFTVEPL